MAHVRVQYHTGVKDIIIMSTKFPGIKIYNFVGQLYNLIV